MLFHNYEYFLTIVEKKTISAAADRLYITQSALSKYLKRLETMLGTQLFTRTNTTMSLTYAGEQYLSTAQKILQQEQAFRKTLEEIRRKDRGSLSIGVSRWRSGYVLSKFLPAYQIANPKVELNINVENSTTILRDLEEKKIDVGILSLGLIQGNQEYASALVFEENLLLAANRAHPLIRRLMSEGIFAAYSIHHRRYPVISMEDVRNEEFILLENTRSETRQIMDLFNQHDITPRISKNAQNINSLLFGVASSTTFAFIPETGVLNNVLPEDVVFLSLGPDTIRVPVMAVTQVDQVDRSIPQGAVEILRDVFQDAGTEDGSADNL